MVLSISQESIERRSSSCGYKAVTLISAKTIRNDADGRCLHYSLKAGLASQLRRSKQFGLIEN
jgi:hypothetical protein